MDEQAKDSPYVEIFSGPLCGYCHRAKAVLARRGLRYREIDVSSAKGREEMTMRLPHAKTIPQIFIGGRHVGGCEDLERLDSAGALGLVESGGLFVDAQPVALDMNSPTRRKTSIEERHSGSGQFGGQHSIGAAGFMARNRAVGDPHSCVGPNQDGDRHAQQDQCGRQQLEGVPIQHMPTLGKPLTACQHAIALHQHARARSGSQGLPAPPHTPHRAGPQDINPTVRMRQPALR